MILVRLRYTGETYVRKSKKCRMRERKTIQY